MMSSLDALGGWVLDSGAVIAFAQGDDFVRSVIASCRARGQTVLICDTSLAVALDVVPEAFDQLLALRCHSSTWLAVLASADRAAVTALLPKAGGDLELAHVVYEAARRGYAVLSDRRAELLAVDRSLFVEAA